MLLSCEGGAAKFFFLSRAIVRNARRPQKQKNSLSTLCFSYFSWCVSVEQVKRKREKKKKE